MSRDLLLLVDALAREIVTRPVKGRVAASSEVVGHSAGVLSGRAIPIGYGVLSADELQDRIFLLTSKEAGHDY